MTKRIFDICISFFALLVFLPVILIVTIVLSVINRGNPFFLQLRPGYKGKLFRIVKFKTMNNKRDSKGQLLPDEMRLTKIGQLVRKMSLDELPQLVNVLIGDMSLVGPRPLLPEYLKLYTPFQKRRHEVRPGITGWAQVNGRNAISWEKKFELDVWYVDNLSLKTDMVILYKTISKVFRSEGISEQNHVTVTKFRGN